MEGGEQVERNVDVLQPGNQCSQSTAKAMQLLNERVDDELFAALLSHIKSLGITGSILVFLPGWNKIFSLMKYLEGHPLFG